MIGRFGNTENTFLSFIYKSGKTLYYHTIEFLKSNLWNIQTNRITANGVFYISPKW